MEKKQTLIKLKDNTIITNKSDTNKNIFFTTFINKIKSNLKTEINSNKINIEFLEIENKYFIIKIFYLKQTEFNFFNSEIIFYIKINYLFPETFPTINCISNFIFPTLFDGRNFFNEIVFNNNNFNSLIKNEIPNMIKKYVNNIKNKIYSFIGEYIIDYAYDINFDFLMNENNLIYNKIIIENDVNNNNFVIIMTQICLLFFELFDDNYEYYKLIEYYEIRNIKNVVINNDSNFVVVNFNVEKEINKKISFYNNDDVKNFYDNLNKRINVIKNFFEIYNKGNKENNINILINTIEYKEKNMLILNNNTDIIEDYQKLIELLCENNDERYEFYIKKFQKLIENFK
jgi:hypothetical protein